VWTTVERRGESLSVPEMNAVLSHKIEVAPGLAILRVTPRGWELPDFRPGQFAVLGLPSSATRCGLSDQEAGDPGNGKLIRRAYSIASSSQAREYLEFYVTLVYSGALSPRLFALEPGDELWLGPKITGTFTLDQAPVEKDVVLVATGTGLAPYMSMLRTVLPQHGERRIAVLLGARHSWDLGYHAELVAMQRLCPTFSYHPTISRPEDEPVPWTGRTGYVQDLWRGGVVSGCWGYHPTADNSSVFLCGNPGMVDEMLAELTDEGFAEHTRKHPGQVFVERYW
jgi:ferredoxin--NADP+ reductase